MGPFLRLRVLALAGVALAACGSDRSPAPVPVATPVATRAFVHVLDHTPDRSDPRLATYHLTTFSVDARTGSMAPVGALLAASGVSYPPPSLAADPLGRFVYFSPGSSSKGSVRCYRVDAGTGALTPAGEAPPLNADTLLLAPTGTELFFGGSEPFGTHHWYQTLRASAVEQSGRLTASTLSLREFDFAGGYYQLLAADAEREVFYVTRNWGDVLVAARVDSSRPEGYREVAALALAEGEGGPNIESIDTRNVTECLAADGILLVLRAAELFSFVLNDRPATLVPRGHLANAATIGSPAAYLHGLLATGASSNGASYPNHSTGINLYGVGTGGELRPQGGLAEGSVADVYALGFHPSGRFLYAAGSLPDRVSELSLLSFSVMPDGSLRPFTSTRLSATDETTVDKLVVTAAEP